MDQGIIYVISAPSGAGKSSLIQALLKNKLCGIQASISHTTRLPRSGEVHSKHYFFVNKKEFEALISKDAFLEYAEVFGKYYGTSHEITEKILKSGADVFLNIDWQGAKQIRKKIPQSRSIFILPPSKGELDRRLRRRGQDNEDVITNRMRRAVIEMNHYSEYDYTIINDDFDTALCNLKSIICAERLRTSRQKRKYSNLIAELLED